MRMAYTQGLSWCGLPLENALFACDQNAYHWIVLTFSRGGVCFVFTQNDCMPTNSPRHFFEYLRRTPT